MSERDLPVPNSVRQRSGRIRLVQPVVLTIARVDFRHGCSLSLERTAEPSLPPGWYTECAMGETLKTDAKEESVAPLTRFPQHSETNRRFREVCEASERRYREALEASDRRHWKDIEVSDRCYWKDIEAVDRRYREAIEASERRYRERCKTSDRRFRKN